MKKLILMIFLKMIFICGMGQVAYDHGIAYFELSAIDSALYYSFEGEHSDSINTAPDRVEQNRDEILIKTNMGKAVRLPRTSIGVENQTLYYEYYGFSTALKCYVVIEHHYEGTSVVLINESNGQFEEIRNLPVVSPDGRYIANMSGNSPMEGEPIGLQLWNVVWKEGTSTVENIYPLIDINQLYWVPIRIQWRSNTQLWIEAVKIEKYHDVSGNRGNKPARIPGAFLYLELKLK